MSDKPNVDLRLRADEIRPALTPEEWAQSERAPLHRVHGGDKRWYYVLDEGTLVIDEGIVEDREASVPPQDRHALAALALHGQPEGFTWEDVDALRCIAEAARIVGLTPVNGYDGATHVEDLARRIGALLPPRAK